MSAAVVERDGGKGSTSDRMRLRGWRSFRAVKLGAASAELYYSPSGWFTGGDSRKKGTGGEVDMETRQRNKARAESRARTMIRQLVVAHKLEYFWTLTFAREVSTIDEAWLEFRKFRRRVNYSIPEWRFVVVPELQKRGVWHFHLCCNTRLEHAVIAKLWGNGFVWVQHVRPENAARYMCKYLTKAFGDVSMGDHRYKRSRRLELETVCGAADSLDEAVRLSCGEDASIVWQANVDETGGVYAVLNRGGPL